jgi:poly(beta-D-mannuronate) lyase
MTLRFALVRLLTAVVTLVGLSAVASAMPLEERQKLDLSAYTVTDTHAGYFDVAKRRKDLARTDDHMLLRQISDLRALDVCPESKVLPVVDGKFVIPPFYEDRDGWKKAALPFQQFEDAVSKLAAKQVVDPASGAGGCLIDLLDRWAAANAFLDISVKVSGLQTWFQTESSIFSAALGYSLVRDDLDGHDDQKARIETWLAAAARNHMLYDGGDDGTCCNNHFYRRAVYATTIGILTKDNELFRFGISAIYSALSDASADGGLKLEMARKQFAAKYQVYAAMHLAMIAQLASRQGYDLYKLKYEGRTLGQVIDFAVGNMLKPESAAQASGTPGQDATFLEDGQYFGWLELLAGKKQWKDATQALLAAHRPAYNRGLGGYMTLYYLAIP